MQLGGNVLWFQQVRSPHFSHQESCGIQISKIMQVSKYFRHLCAGVECVSSGVGEFILLCMQLTQSLLWWLTNSSPLCSKHSLPMCKTAREDEKKKKKAAREKKVKKGGGGGGKETEGDLGEVRWILMSSLRVSDRNLCLFCLKHCSCLRSAYTEEHRATITKQTQTPQWCC